MPMARHARLLALLAVWCAGPALAQDWGWLARFEASPQYKAVRPLMREAAQAHQVDYALLKAVVATESGFDPVAVSPKGAVGLMQLMPATAQRYGLRGAEPLRDARANLGAGARYLADLIRLFDGELNLALAAYNAGEGAVLRAGRQVPDYAETRHYVATVLQLYERLQTVPH